MTSSSHTAIDSIFITSVVAISYISTQTRTKFCHCHERTFRCNNRNSCRILESKPKNGIPLSVCFSLHHFPVYKQTAAPCGETDYAEIGIIGTGKMICQAIIPHPAADFRIGTDLCSSGEGNMVCRRVQASGSPVVLTKTHRTWRTQTCTILPFRCYRTFLN